MTHNSAGSFCQDKPVWLGAPLIVCWSLYQSGDQDLEERLTVFAVLLKCAWSYHNCDPAILTIQCAYVTCLAIIFSIECFGNSAS